MQHRNDMLNAVSATFPATEQAANGFKTPAPIFEWEGEGPWSPLFASDDIDRGESAQQLFDLQLAYQRAEFGKARTLAERIIAGSDDDSVVLSAMTTRFNSRIAMGDGDAAYAELPELVRRCEEGLSGARGMVLNGMSLLCSMRINAILMADVVKVPSIDEGFDKFPGGLKAYLGYLIALRELRAGRTERAAGIVYAFRKIIGSHYPVSHLCLMLLSVATDILEGNPEEGEGEFRRAWRFFKETGIVMPFVELNYVLCGMPRRCFPGGGDGTYRAIEGLVRNYHKGWYGVRRRCGIHDVSESLSPVECYALCLAGLGWRNKEIANHLDVSENTVKHQLSSCYQKLGISGRADIRAMMNDMMVSDGFAIQ